MKFAILHHYLKSVLQEEDRCWRLREYELLKSKKEKDVSGQWKSVINEHNTDKEQ
ncbi:hypothetical protein A3Q56_08794, partial [Intoshia linei]